jgi:hypothetical protein
MHAEAALAHAGTGCENRHFAPMDAVGAAVQVGNPIGDANCSAVALHHSRKLFECIAPRIAYANCAKGVRNLSCGDFVEPRDGISNDRLRRDLRRCRVQAGNAVSRDIDHATSVCKIANGLGVLRCVDDGGRFGRQPRDVPPELLPPGTRLELVKTKPAEERRAAGIDVALDGPNDLRWDQRPGPRWRGRRPGGRGAADNPVPHC